MFSEDKQSLGRVKNKELVQNLFSQTHIMVLNIKKLHK